MPIYTDVETRLNRRALESTASEIRTAVNRLGAELSGNLSGALSRSLGALDSRGARAELVQLESAWRRAADVQMESARRMESSARQVEVAQARAAEMSAKYTETHSKAIAANAALADAQARSARDMRLNTDALAASEAAHQAHTRALEDSAGATALAGRAFNAAGIGSLAVYTGAVLESTKAAGDFQASQTRLVASAGETAQNLKAVSDGILNLAGQVGYTAQDLSNNMYMVEKAGYRGADGVTVLKSAAQGAKSENADLKEVLSGLTTSMHDFGYTADQSADVMSKMVTATSLARTNFQDFSGALHSAEPLIGNIGQSQKLTGQQMQHLMADLYGIGAQMTQTGDTAQHSFELIGHATSKLLGPTSQMRDMMGALGLDADDVTSHLGERGLTGTLQMLEQAVQAHTKDGRVQLDVMYKNAQAARAEEEAYNKLPPAARRVADEIKNNTLAYADFRKSRGGLMFQDANLVEQWAAAEKKLTGFSSAIKSGIGDNISYDQAMKMLTGDQETLRVALQASGENQDAVNDKIKQIDKTTREHDGTVKGFNETQETLNAKMADAKAAFGAAAIEIGSAFIPFMTSAANIAKDVGDTMGRHPAIMHAVVDAVGAMGAAWAGFKAMNILDAVLSPIVRGLGGIIAGEEAATAGAGRLSGALGALGKAGAAGLAAQLGGQALQDATEGDDFWHGAAVVGTDAATGAAFGAGVASIVPGIGTAVGGAAGGLIGGGIGLYNQLSRASGGPLWAPGPKGHDSAVFHGADGEHVVTHPEVQAAGGHAGIYRVRRALLDGNLAIVSRAGGGPIGPDVAAAEAMAGTAYSQGNRTDCSGMVGRVVGSVTGGGGGLPTTQNMGEWLAARGFVPGIGGPGTISVGWYNHGSSPNDGHAAMTLSDGENAESGGSHGNFIVGGSVGASSAQFDRHMYLPELYGEGSGGSFGGGGFGGGGGGLGGYGGGMGGGIPAGSTAGRGPGGQPGYYSPNPEKVASAQEQLRHTNEEIRIAEERKANLKASASQAEKDKLDEEIRHLQAQREREEERLQKAQQGTFHESRGGRGGGGNSPFMPVPLASNPMSKGLPGLAEWAVGFLEDLVLGPLETGAMAAMNGTLGSGLGSGLGGGFGSPGLTPGALLDAPGIGGGGGGSRGNNVGGDGAGSGNSGAAGPTSGVGAKGGSGLLGFLGNRSTGDSNAAGTPAGAASFYKDRYSPQPDMSLSGLPPEMRAWAQQHGMVGPDGNYAGPIPFAPDRSVRPPEHVSPFGGAPDAPHRGVPPGGPTYGPPSHLPDSAWTPTPAHVDPPALPPSSRQGFNFDGAGSGGNGFDSGGSSNSFPGGPKGRDYIPAWLGDDEYVEQKSAVDKYGYGFMDALNRGDIDPALVQYHDGGLGTTPPPNPPPQPALPPSGPQNAGSTKPQGPAPQKGVLPGGMDVSNAAPARAVHDLFGPPGSAPTGPTAAGSGVDIHEDLSNLSTPGAGDQRPGAGLPASPGLGISGGAIGAAEGAAEGAASAAGNAFAPGSGSAMASAMSVGFQELNRAAAAGAQAAGVGVEGILETVIPDSSGTGGDWMKTIPGRVLSGVAGARPAGTNTAGQTQPAVPGGGQAAQYSGMGGQGGSIYTGDIHVTANDADQMHQSVQAKQDEQAAMSGHMLGANSGYAGGRGSSL